MVVSGESTSRLSELRKYVITTGFTKQYVSGGSYINDGVDYDNSTSINDVIYYIGGIQYNDTLITSGDESYIKTEYSFNSLGTGDTNNFITAPIFKDPKNDNIIDKPKISSDVFVIRQEINVFERSYRLAYVDNLLDVTTYAGGNYFNVINNT